MLPLLRLASVPAFPVRECELGFDRGPDCASRIHIPRLDQLWITSSDFLIVCQQKIATLQQGELRGSERAASARSPTQPGVRTRQSSDPACTGIPLALKRSNSLHLAPLVARWPPPHHDPTTILPEAPPSTCHVQQAHLRAHFKPA